MSPSVNLNVEDQFSRSKNLGLQSYETGHLTFDMRGGRKWAKPACGRPLMEGLGIGFVANHFDVVPVRTNDESCIVVRVVVRA